MCGGLLGHLCNCNHHRKLFECGLRLWGEVMKWFSHFLKISLDVYKISSMIEGICTGWHLIAGKKHVEHQSGIGRVPC